MGWLHMPKTGTSFAISLMRTANGSLPLDADVRKCDCTQECLHVVQGVDLLLRYPLRETAPGIFWTKKSGDFTDHQSLTAANGATPFLGRLFAMFREPFDRAWSAYQFFEMEEPGEKGLAPVSFAAYTKRIRGNAVAMLTGQIRNGLVCLDKDFDPLQETTNVSCPKFVPNVDAAIRRLNDFAFVGLQEEWPLSVCLLHAAHGGTCSPDVENADSRPTPKGFNIVRPTQTPELTDPYDTALYAAVKSRFWADVHKHGLSQTVCEQRGCWPRRSADR